MRFPGCYSPFFRAIVNELQKKLFFFRNEETPFTFLSNISKKNEHKRIDEYSIEKKKEILSFFLPTTKAFSLLK